MKAMGQLSVNPDRHTVTPAAILPLVVHDLCYEIGGKHLLDGISFRTDAGPRTVVLGPNGAGKSLLLRLCHGLLQPSAGTIAWAGTAPETARRCQAMVFQRPVLLRRSTAANITYVLRLQGIPRRQRRAMTMAALEQAGLLPLAAQPARVLSGGEQQRLALTRAWTLKPQVLFLDEPTASLDPAATQAVEALLDHIHRTDTKIIMTTHDLGQARRLADEVLFLHHGRLLEHAPATAFFSHPQSKEATAFLEGKLLW
jgi:tungstate transport system ATP-binding protein